MGERVQQLLRLIRLDRHVTLNMPDRHTGTMRPQLGDRVNQPAVDPDVTRITQPRIRSASASTSRASRAAPSVRASWPEPVDER
jgi:hypothetical protein